MDDTVFEDVEEGRGKAFGNRVHDFAEEYAAGKADGVGGTGEDDEAGKAIEPPDDDEAHVRDFIDSLEGDLTTEVDAHLPLSVDGRQVMISGTIDLVHVTPERVEVIDYKTDPGRQAEAEYRKQLSIYYHVALAAYPDRTVNAAILYTATGELEDVTPLTRDELSAVVAERDGRKRKRKRRRG